MTSQYYSLRPKVKINPVKVFEIILETSIPIPENHRKEWVQCIASEIHYTCILKLFLLAAIYIQML